MELPTAISKHSRGRRFNAVAFAFALSVSGWARQAPATGQKYHTARTQRGTVEYINREYGFRFTLPESWVGYRILWSEWQGNVLTNRGEVAHHLRGPRLVIRHPKWTQEKPHEDMPILIYTIAQWREGPVVSAAPLYPKELGRNQKYVFAVPPRWDYDFSEGYEEAEKILTPLSLHTFAPRK
jgi:hypothetical protein